MSPKKYLQKFVAAVVERSGVCRPTVEAVLPHVFDEIRYQLTEGDLCVPIESFGTFAVVDIPERQRRYTYGGRDEIRTLPPKKKLKFAPTRNLRLEVESSRYDPTRRSFVLQPGDPPIRKRKHLKYCKNRKGIWLKPINDNDNDNVNDNDNDNDTLQ